MQYCYKSSVETLTTGFWENLHSISYVMMFIQSCGHYAKQWVQITTSE